MEFKYKTEIPDPRVRKEECMKIRSKHPEKVPILFQRDPKSQIKELPKTKYLISKDMSVNHFLLLLRDKLELGPADAFFLLVAGKYSILGEQTMEEIYNKFRDPEDDFLYLMYSTEQVWG